MRVDFAFDKNVSLVFNVLNFVAFEYEFFVHYFKSQLLFGLFVLDKINLSVSALSDELEDFEGVEGEFRFRGVF
jgi:hypothetical protein